MGEMAAQQLLKRIQNPNDPFPDTIMFEPELMKRESTMAVSPVNAPKKRSSLPAAKPGRRAR
jgi:LacI family transcriptional regulator